MKMDIEIDSRELHAAFKKAPIKVLEELRDWVHRTSARTERAAKKDLKGSVSHGASGETGSSIHMIISMGGLSSTVKPTTKASYWVHEGRGPGKMPPFKEGTSLHGWARRMGMNPFLVARSIGKKGTKGHPFMDNAYEEVKPLADRDAVRTLDRIVRSI